MVDARFKAKIINALRRLSRTWAPRNRAKSTYRVDKALHKCAKCDIYCYEGSSKKNFEALQIKYGIDKLVFERGHMDHIEPAINPEKGWENWDVLIEQRMFPEEEGWQHLCTTCHQVKSNIENKTRRDTKKMIKKTLIILLMFLSCKEVTPVAQIKTIQLTGSNFVLFRDDFNVDSSSYYATKMVEMSMKNPKEHLYIIFDTNGGDNNAFEVVLKVASELPNPISTITMNSVSAGYFSVQLIKGKRLITPDGKMMSHRWHWLGGFVYKTVPQWIKFYKEKNIEEKDFYRLISDRLGMPLFVYLTKIDKDYYISKELALTENHVDEEVKIKCDDSIPEYEPYTMTTRSAQYTVFRSGCPLLNLIDSIKLVDGFPSLGDAQEIANRLMAR